MCKRDTVAEHMDYLNKMILGAFNDTYEILHVYDMGPKFHGYAARMSNEWEKIKNHYVVFQLILYNQCTF